MDLDALLADVKAKIDAFKAAQVAAQAAADALAQATAASNSAAQASDHAHVDVDSAIQALEAALDSLK